MNELEKQIKQTFNNLTAELTPPVKIRENIFVRLGQLNCSYPMFIRIPVALSFFTTIIAVPISVY